MMLPCELICQGFHSEVFLAVCVLNHFSRVRLFATPWTVAHQAPLSVGFSRQEYWSGLIAMPSSTGSSQLKDRTHVLMSPALAGQFFTASATWEAPSWLSGLNCRNLFSHSFTGQKSKIRVRRPECMSPLTQGKGWPGPLSPIPVGPWAHCNSSTGPRGDSTEASAPSSRL